MDPKSVMKDGKVVDTEDLKRRGCIPSIIEKYPIENGLVVDRIPL
jgi:hypothetical protein